MCTASKINERNYSQAGEVIEISFVSERDPETEGEL